MWHSGSMNKGASSGLKKKGGASKRRGRTRVIRIYLYQNLVSRKNGHVDCVDNRKDQRIRAGRQTEGEGIMGVGKINR